MKKLLVLSLSLMLLLPSICLAGNTKTICGNVKQVFKYKTPKKNIQYRYAVIEQYYTFNDETATYDRQLPYGLYMFKLAPNVKWIEQHNCFEIDMQKQMIISSTAAGQECIAEFVASTTVRYKFLSSKSGRNFFICAPKRVMEAALHASAGDSPVCHRGRANESTL